MKIIVDSNIIISSLISENSKERDFILTSGEELITSKFCVIEIFKYKEKISQCSKLPEEMVLNYYYKILERITLINEKLISEENYKKAYKLCKNTDKKDILFVALTIELDDLLWTGDKKLIKALRLNRFKKIYDFANKN